MYFLFIAAIITLVIAGVICVTIGKTTIGIAYLALSGIVLLGWAKKYQLAFQTFGGSGGNRKGRKRKGIMDGSPFECIECGTNIADCGIGDCDCPGGDCGH